MNISAWNNRAWFGINAPACLPNGQIVDSGVTLEDYEARVQAYEDQDICRSDAQGIVDVEILKGIVCR